MYEMTKIYGLAHLQLANEARWAEMQMIRWMCGISLKDRRTNEELRRLVEPITTFIRSGRLRRCGHVMRKGDEDWVKKCMELKAEDRLKDQERHG